MIKLLLSVKKLVTLIRVLKQFKDSNEIDDDLRKEVIELLFELSAKLRDR